MSTSLIDKEVLLRITKEIVDKHQPKDYRLVVSDAWFSEMYQDWIVSVDADHEDVSGADFAQRLVDVEEEVRERTGKKIHVHPPMWRPD
jgi:hypothetical protein